MSKSYKLKSLLKQFGIEELKTILGNSLVDQLIEWETRPLTKALLVDMIVSIHGVSILRDRFVRKRILEQLPEKELLDFRSLLGAKLKNTRSLPKIVEAISAAPWRPNKITLHFINLLGYDEDAVFEHGNQSTVAVESVDSHERFFELLDYQYIIRQQALSILESPITLSRFLIHMPTGTGKTKTAMHIASHYLRYDLKKKGLILWVAHTKELLQQASETFAHVWRNIGEGSTCEYRLWDAFEPSIPSENFNGIMICGIQKLMAIKSGNPELFNQIHKDLRLLIFDEAHKASATETKQIINELMTCPMSMEDRSLMGLTATPGRTTENSSENVHLSSLFGNKSIGIDVKLMNAVNLSPQEALNAHIETNIIKYFQERKILSKITREELVYSEDLSEEELEAIKIAATDNGYDDYTRKSLEIIGRNKSRNITIKKKLQELHGLGIPTIVFACSIAHARLLSGMLSLEGVPNAVITGDMAALERSEAIANFKNTNHELNMLINYEVLTTGFDATNIGCVFIARPTKSIVLYSQMLGRGLRGPQMGGNEECLLVDIKDNLSRFDGGEDTYSYFSLYW